MVAVMDTELMAATAAYAKLIAPPRVVTREGKRNWSEDNTSEVSHIFNDFICPQVCPIGEMLTIDYSDIHIDVVETLVKYIASDRYSQ